jgi:tetratricopeptide (TPR) repeat protein
MVNLMHRSVCGAALVLIVLLSGAMVAGADLQVYLQWDGEEAQVYAGYSTSIDVTVLTSSTGEPTTTPPPTTSPPPTTTPLPTPPEPPEESTFVTGGGMGMPGTGSTSSFKMANVNNIYLSAMGPPEWDVTLSEDRLILEDNDSGVVTVDVSVPEGEAPGLYEIQFTATSSIGDRTLLLPVRVLEPYDVVLSNIVISPEEPALGDTVNVSVDVTVNGDVNLPDKILGLYIPEIAQGNLASTTVSFDPNSTQTVTLSWGASQLGDLTAKMYLNPHQFDSDVSNNSIETAFTVQEAEDPCTLAQETFDAAMEIYEEDCEAARSQLEMARALYEQCGDEEGVAQCEALLEKCDKYGLAEELVEQGDAFADQGDCESAIEKWQDAREIYASYDDDAMVQMIDDRIESCEPEDETPWYMQTWSLGLLLLLILLLILLIILTRRREEEEEEGPPSEFYGEAAPVPPPGPSEGGEGAQRTLVTPVAPGRTAPTPSDPDAAKLVDGLDKAVAHYDPETIRKDLKGAVSNYSKIVDRRNTLAARMDKDTLDYVDEQIRILEDKIFNEL